MTPILRKLLIFVLQFVPMFLLSFVLYFVVLPVYGPIVLSTANFVTERMNPSTEIERLESGVWMGYSFTPEQGRRGLRGWTPSTVHLMLLSLALLPALLLATPAPYLTRLRLLAIGVPLVFLSHVAWAIVLSRAVLCLRQAPGTFYCLWALRATYASGQFTAAALWVLLTWRYWFPDMLAANVAPAGTGADTRTG